MHSCMITSLHVCRRCTYACMLHALCTHIHTHTKHWHMYAMHCVVCLHVYMPYKHAWQKCKHIGMHEGMYVCVLCVIGGELRSVRMSVPRLSAWQHDGSCGRCWNSILWCSNVLLTIECVDASVTMGVCAGTVGAAPSMRGGTQWCGVCACGSWCGCQQPY